MYYSTYENAGSKYEEHIQNPRLNKEVAARVCAAIDALSSFHSTEITPEQWDLFSKTISELRLKILPVYAPKHLTTCEEDLELGRMFIDSDKARDYLTLNGVDLARLAQMCTYEDKCVRTSPEVESYINEKIPNLPKVARNYFKPWFILVHSALRK